MSKISNNKILDERTVVSVEPKSPAQMAGIEVDDIIVSVNGEKICDELDWQFHTTDEEYLDILIGRNGRTIRVEIELDSDNDIGIHLAPLRIRRCGNRCVFCFIDQLPKNLRNSLYFKDGDFRISFLRGSYITMTNLTDDDWKRIIYQQMSPLYISVHSTDEMVRRKLLGNDKIPPIMGQLKKLAENRIQFHAQIVLVPGYNDGDILNRTIDDLLIFYPYLLSLAIVPVGLTGHREHLTHLEPVSYELATEIIERHYEIRKNNKNARKTFQLADEFFLLANRHIPNTDDYCDYPQYENGVGMVRYFLDSIENWHRENFPDLNGLEIGIITGELFAPILNKSAIEKIETLSGCSLEIIAAKNKLFGEYVNVANLLSGQDIIDAVNKFECSPDLIILPPRVVNADGLFLDDTTLDEIIEQIGIPMMLSPENLDNFGTKLESFI